MEKPAENPLDALTIDGSPAGATVISALGEIRAARKALEDAVRRYDEERLRIYRLRLEERQVEWCSYRNHPVAKGATRLLFAQSGKWHYLHLACSECVIEAMSQQVDDGDNFYKTTLVRREDGRVFETRSGREVLCRPEVRDDHPARTDVPDGASAQLDVPPRLELRQPWNDGPFLEIGDAHAARRMLVLPTDP